MPILNDKKIILILVFFLAGISWANFTFASCNASGWAYSDTVGWISFSCKTCPPGGNETNPCGNESFCTSPDWDSYGVKIDSTGLFSDYAWNGYVGWISFNQEDLELPIKCPAEPCEARQNSSTHQITGWGKIISLSSSPGGGWISMSCKTDPKITDKSLCDLPAPEGYEDYGIYYEQCELRGWAWSDDIGWICFNCNDDQTVSSTQCNRDTGEYKDYGVRCGEPAQKFNLNSVSLVKDRPCSATQLSWENKGDVSYYNIYRNEVLVKKLTVLSEAFPSCPEGEECISCILGICTYPDDEGLKPQTSYSYKVYACSSCGCREADNSPKLATTTICPPTLTFCPTTEPIESCHWGQPNSCPSLTYSTDPDSPFKMCIESSCNNNKGGIKLEWDFAKGWNGNDYTDGADRGYTLYRALGGEGYQENPGKSLFARYGDEGGENPEGYYYSGYYVWELSTGGSLGGGNLFEIGQHYYFFVRATDSSGQSVDSNIVDICCLSSNPD